jgi:prefoldin subunit 5
VISLDEKVLEILGQMQAQMGEMQNQMSHVVERMDRIETKIGSIDSRMDTMETIIGRMESDISSIKETANRIETHQHDDLVATLERIDKRVEQISEWKEETDNVVDLLAQRTTRLQAKMKINSSS